MDWTLAWLEGLEFMPHGQCILWDSWILWPRVAAHFVIFLSYMVISWSISRYVRKLPAPQYRWLGWGFVLFIGFCGVTHAGAILVNWWAAYRPENVLLAVTALFSAGTAYWVRVHLPDILALPNIADLQARAATHDTDMLRLRGALEKLEKHVQDRQASEVGDV